MCRKKTRARARWEKIESEEKTDFFQTRIENRGLLLLLLSLSLSPLLRTDTARKKHQQIHGFGRGMVTIIHKTRTFSD